MYATIRCSNCGEDLPENEFSEFELGKFDSICNLCIDEMDEDESEEEEDVDSDLEEEDDSEE